MKKFSTNFHQVLYHFFLVAVLISASLSSYAANHRVGCENYKFVPDTFTANVGDTVTWYYINGIEHEPYATAATIPSGASGWNGVVGPADTAFQYVIAVPGTYNYICKIHVDSGMVGQFVANIPAGIAPVELNQPLKVYPIPFQQNLTIDLSRNNTFKNSVNIEISNIIGQRKFYVTSSEVLFAPMTFDLSDLESGIYFLTVSDGVNKKTMRLVKSE